MRNLKLVLQREPAAIGSLVASILPVLVLLGLIQLDEAGIAAVVVAINTVVGFAIRVAVAPLTPRPAPTGPAPSEPDAPRACQASGSFLALAFGDVTRRQRLAPQPHRRAGERQRAPAQRRPALGLAAVQQPRRRRRGAQQRRVVGQPARRAQARRLRRELARGDVLRRAAPARPATRRRAR